MPPKDDPRSERERVIAELQERSGLSRSSCEAAYSAIEVFGQRAFNEGYRMGYSAALKGDRNERDIQT